MLGLTVCVFRIISIQKPVLISYGNFFAKVGIPENPFKK